MEESYLMVETIRKGVAQMIALPPPVDTNAPDKADLELIHVEVVKSVEKRQQKLEESLKKGYATVYDQCSLEVRDKLEASDEWNRVQRDQSLHDLINKIERICVGFDDHKQEVFNLIQALKTLFLYSQRDKETVEQYGWNFCALWEKVEAFGGSPGIHQGMIEGMLNDGTRVATAGRPTAAEKKKAEEDATEAVKAALLISGADKTRFGRLKDELANNYLLGSDQYPNTLEKAARILANYQVTRVNPPYRASPIHQSRSRSAPALAGSLAKRSVAAFMKACSSGTSAGARAAATGWAMAAGALPTMRHPAGCFPGGWLTQARTT